MGIESDVGLGALKMRLDAMAETLLEHDNRLVKHQDKIQGWSERWDGTQKRIELVQGTLQTCLANHAQLLTRFEDWKKIGNELASQGVDHAREITKHAEVLDKHATLLAGAGEALLALKTILTDMRAAILSDATEQIENVGR